VLAELPTRAEREPVVAQGEGGDDTTAIDAAAESVILARFDGVDATIVSEEVGSRGSGTMRVVIDPIDGSLNAKRGIPFFSLSIAVADGPTMGDIHFGFVYDFGSGEEWTAMRGEGAFLDGEPLGDVRPKDTIELLVMEATRTDLVAADAPKVAALAHRLRIMGSTALSLCHLAAGRVDGVCTLKPTRSVDIAAGQLLCREVGLAGVRGRIHGKVFARDAAFVEADTAESRALHERDLASVLGGADRAHVARGTAADDQDVDRI